MYIYSKTKFYISHSEWIISFPEWCHPHSPSQINCNVNISQIHIVHNRKESNALSSTADHHQEALPWDNGSLYATPSVSSHIHTCQRTSSPTCVEVPHKGLAQLRNDSTHTTSDKKSDYRVYHKCGISRIRWASFKLCDSVSVQREHQSTTRLHGRLKMSLWPGHSGWRSQLE